MSDAGEDFGGDSGPAADCGVGGFDGSEGGYGVFSSEELQGAESPILIAPPDGGNESAGSCGEARGAFGHSGSQESAHSHSSHSRARSAEQDSVGSCQHSSSKRSVDSHKDSPGLADDNDVLLKVETPEHHGKGEIHRAKTESPPKTKKQSPGKGCCCAIA